jgi:dTDP-4-amino-4,6-dideoxygalactose transaminase
MMKHLKDAGIGSAIHYPVPLHLQRAYVSLNYGAGDFPVTESAAAEIVSLPMYPQLTTAQLEKVAVEVMDFAPALENLVSAVPTA